VPQKFPLPLGELSEHAGLATDGLQNSLRSAQQSPRALHASSQKQLGVPVDGLLPAAQSP
jgi:hypothetical protein